MSDWLIQSFRPQAGCAAQRSDGQPCRKSESAVCVGRGFEPVEIFEAGWKLGKRQKSMHQAQVPLFPATGVENSRVTTENHSSMLMWWSCEHVDGVLPMLPALSFLEGKAGSLQSRPCKVPKTLAKSRRSKQNEENCYCAHALLTQDLNGQSIEGHTLAAERRVRQA